MRDESLARDATNPNDEGKPVWLVSIEWIDALNLEIMRAYREKRNVKFECPPGVASCFAEALLHYTDLKMPLLRAMVSIEDNIINAANVAEQMMKDEYMRFFVTPIERSVSMPTCTLQPCAVAHAKY